MRIVRGADLLVKSESPRMLNSSSRQLPESVSNRETWVEDARMRR